MRMQGRANRPACQKYALSCNPTFMLYLSNAGFCFRNVIFYGIIKKQIFFKGMLSMPKNTRERFIRSVVIVILVFFIFSIIVPLVPWNSFL